MLEPVYGGELDIKSEQNLTMPANTRVAFVGLKQQTRGSDAHTSTLQKHGRQLCEPPTGLKLVSQIHRIKLNIY